MTERTHTTRRTALRGIAGAFVAGGVLGSAGAAAAESGWTVAETPTDRDLYDVAETDAGAYAVGGGGDVLRRDAGGWTRVIDGGPTGNGNSLYGADVSDDGERLWFVGASGAIGEYDVTTGSLTDYSAPNDVTNNFNGVAVAGPADEENVYVAGDSGKIYYSFDGGETFDQVTPGSGSAIDAIDFHGDRAGHAVDGNQTVFSTDDGGTYDRLGIENANVNFYAVDSDAPDEVYVAGGGGTVYEWNGTAWDPTDLGDAGLRDVEVEDGAGLTVGGGGTVFELAGGDWTRLDTPTGANLKAVVRGDPDVAVGASGTVIER
ncbi:WD40/YVTN/BNR-like repeat-containing protein [Halobaculum sp. EA56]|uniref:WD40/YVTN/BNR-like repeat-containing protein n=1 Tax=Halobaculum sp. EA56 TaxID=3421648 RepID=UPI003EBF2955